MHDLGRFVVFIVAASFVFLAAILFVTRKRAHKPRLALLSVTTFVVVVCGMLFARYGYILFHPPWWIYYGVPALNTFLLPPFALRMKRAEFVLYVPLAVLMAPFIHVFFSLMVGWHDYMPFPWYIPSVTELMHRL